MNLFPAPYGDGQTQKSLPRVKGQAESSIRLRQVVAYFDEFAVRSGAEGRNSGQTDNDDQSQHYCVLNSGWTIFGNQEPLDAFCKLRHFRTPLNLYPLTGTQRCSGKQDSAVKNSAKSRVDPLIGFLLVDSGSHRVAGDRPDCHGIQTTLET